MFRSGASRPNWPFTAIRFECVSKFWGGGAVSGGERGANVTTAAPATPTHHSLLVRSIATVRPLLASGTGQDPSGMSREIAVDADQAARLTQPALAPKQALPASGTCTAAVTAKDRRALSDHRRDVAAAAPSSWGGERSTYDTLMPMRVGRLDILHVPPAPRRRCHTSRNPPQPDSSVAYESPSLTRSPPRPCRLGRRARLSNCRDPWRRTTPRISLGVGADSLTVAANHAGDGRCLISDLGGPTAG